MKWSSIVLWDHYMLLMLYGEFHKTMIRSTILYESKYWVISKHCIKKVSITKIKLLKWMSKITKKDKAKKQSGKYPFLC